MRLIKSRKLPAGPVFPGAVSGLLSVIFCIFALSGCGNRKSAPVYEYTSISRGTLERVVSATGTINPVAEVKVLPQMSGKVERIRVDYNDSVRKGDILAELNTDVLKLQRQQQSASVQKARANYELQMINYNNQEVLAAKNLISEYELKSSKTTLDNQAADLAVAEANLNVIETEINQYAFITSPIDGIVLDRRINVGDTVVNSSSSNSSAIFILAENLNEMQIEAAVSELDVASIRQGQMVRFTLESMPGRNFRGQVQTLRMVPVVTSNVVSYTVIVKVSNQDGSLLPGMTCAVDFIVEQAQNVLTISNAALRYEPTTLNSAQIADMVFNAEIANLGESERKAAIDARAEAQARAAQTAQNTQNQNQNTGLASLMMGGGNRPPMPNMRMQGQGQGQRRNESAAVVMRNLWYMNNGKPEVMRVQTGITNGLSTEIHSAENLEGRQFILRERVNAGN